MKARFKVIATLILINILTSALILGYYNAFGSFTNKRVGDFATHRHCIEMLLNGEEYSYYPPLFHYFVIGFTWVTGFGIEMSMLMVGCWLAVFLVPYLIYEISRSYNGISGDMAVFLYLFGTGSAFIFMYWSVFAQVLNLAIILLSVLVMVSALPDKWKMGFLAALAPLAVFSHAEGAILWFFTVCYWFWVRGYKKMLYSGVVVGIAALFLFPALFELPKGYLKAPISAVLGVDVGYFAVLPDQLFNILVFWVNPVLWVFFFQGLKKAETDNDKVIWFSFLFPILVIYLDLTFRTFLNSLPFLCILAVRGYKKTKAEFVYNCLIALIFIIFLARTARFELLP